MRELVFALEYDPGANPIADVLAGAPGAEMRSISCHATAESLWRVDHASGPADTIDRLEAIVLSTEFYSDCLAEETCGASSRRELLHRTGDELVFYTYWDRTDVCESIPHIALEQFGEGVLFETRRSERRYIWHLVTPREAPAGSFLDRVRDAVRPFASVETVRITSLNDSDRIDAADANALPPEQRAALRAAVDRGYYETPREVSLDDLAADLDLPRSTLSYRLRRAEAKLVKSALRSTDRLQATPF
ncbi:MAG: helix-turn-helix domain-containing protein [Haloplanus sp.]